MKTGIYYCRKDTEEDTFKKFCSIKNIDVKELQKGQTIDSRLLLVLNLPIGNRQNRVEVFSGFIADICEKYEIKGNCRFSKVFVL